MSDDVVRKDVWNAQIETLIVLIEKTNERINDLRDSVNRQFTIMGVMFAALQIGLAVILYFLK